MMEQRSAMGEEDMFLEAETQGQSELCSDDVYISLAQEIAVKKCRLVQRKEKIKLTVQTLKQLNAKIKTAKNELDRLKKEKDEIDLQQQLKALNLKGAKESRASLETVLCDLKSKISSLEEETKEKKDKFSAAIQNAAEKWESYKEVYEQFPLAKKRRELIIEIKKVDIELRQNKYDIEDMKYQKKIKAELAEKRNQVACVKLARAYLLWKEKVEEHNTLQIRVSELQKRKEDLKAEKRKEDKLLTTKLPTSSLTNRESQKTAKSNLLQFKRPQFLISPLSQLDTDDEPPKTGLFDWNTLFSNHNLLNVPKKSQVNQVEALKIAKLSRQIPPQSISTSKILSDPCHKQLNNENDSVTANNIIKKCISSVTDQTSEKRKSSELTETVVENQLDQQPLKKVRFASSPIRQNESDKDKSSTNTSGNPDYTVPDKINETDNKKPNEYYVKLINKEVKSNANISKSSFSIKSFLSMTPSNIKKSSQPEMTMQQNKSVSQNLQNILTTKLSANNKNIIESHLNSPSKDPLVSVSSQKEQPIPQKSTVYHETDMFEDNNNENHPDNITLGMVTSPPDVIPVENNSQPLSQAGSGPFNSFSSEFTTPPELDEAAKLHYHRLVTESPEFVYPKGPGIIKSQKLGTEGSEVVRSQYFSSMPPQATQSENLDQLISPEEAYNSPYSPPDNLGNEPEITTNRSSSPFGLDYLGYGVSASTEKPLINQPSSSESNKSPPGDQFAFSFNSNPSKKSSLFSLF